MIPRRVHEHVKEHNWFAVAIDLLIVVIGVFLGTQVANWNEARGDKGRADGYLARISADLGADLDDYADRLKFWGAVADYGMAGLAYAERGETGGRTSWEILLAYFQASQVAEFFTTSATWDEMRGGGDLRLIDNIDLRRRLARYYTYAANPALSERPACREHVRERIPAGIQAHIWENCYASDSAGRQTFVDCPAPIDDTASSAVIASLAGDETLMRELRYWVSTMQIAARIGRDRVAAATEVKNSVAAELGESPP